MYVGKTTNLFTRLSKYFNGVYIQSMVSKMVICKAIHKYGYNKFSLYVQETCSEDISKIKLANKEANWVNSLRPSYNIQDILIPEFNKGSKRNSLTDEQKLKIKEALTGRKLTDIVKRNI